MASPKTKEFLKVSRERLRTSNPPHHQADDIEIFVSPTKKQGGPVRSFSTRDYVSVTSSDENELFVPREVASRSGCIRRMLQAGMRERNGTIRLAYESSILERVFQFCFEDHLQNHPVSRVRRQLFSEEENSEYLSVPPSSAPQNIPLRNSLPDSTASSLSPSSPRSALSASSPAMPGSGSLSQGTSPFTSPSKKKAVRRTPLHRDEPVVISFAMSPDDVMDYLMVAHFLDIPPLLDSAAKMIAAHIDDVPSLDGVPLEVVQLIYSFLPPFKFAEIENQCKYPDAKKLDTSALWQKAYADRSWDRSDWLYTQAWSERERMTRGDEQQPLEYDDDDSWKTLYLQRALQTEFNSLGPQSDRDELLRRVSVSAQYTRYLSARVEHLTELHIELSEVLHLLPELRFVDLSGSSKLEARVLQQLLACPSLRSVRLSNVNLDAAAIEFMSSVASSSAMLTSLDLSDNNLGGDSLVPLRKLVSLLPNLKEISLANNTFPLKASADRNALLLEILTHKSLELLDLGGNQLELAGLSADVLRALSESNVRSLFLNDTMDSACPQEAFQALVANLPPRLSYLNMANCSLEAPHMAVLYRALKDNKIVTHLDLAENSLGKDSSEFISQLLQENSTLRSLNLKDNRLWDVGGQILASGLQKNCALTRLNLGSNRLRAAATVLASAARSHPTIRWLNLDQNQIPPPQVPLVRKALEGSQLIVVM